MNMNNSIILFLIENVISYNNWISCAGSSASVSTVASISITPRVINRAKRHCDAVKHDVLDFV